MDLEEFVRRLKRHPDTREAFVHHRFLPARPAVHAPAPALRPETEAALRQAGVEQLYAHQVEALGHLRRGRNVIVATPTASGKSLIFNLTVLERVLEDPAARALYLFPLKALEQDQLKTLDLWLPHLAPARVTAEIYDGDTSPYRRKKIRTTPPHILFTNPDMLHRGILAYHQSWEELSGRAVLRDPGRGAHLPRHLRLARQPGHPPAQAALPPLRQSAALHPALGHGQQPGNLRPPP